MMTATLIETKTTEAAPKAARWVACPACGGHGLNDAVDLKDATLGGADRLCPKCEGLGSVRR